MSNLPPYVVEIAVMLYNLAIKCYADVPDDKKLLISSREKAGYRLDCSEYNISQRQHAESIHISVCFIKKHAVMRNQAVT